jgi:23S rRNA (uracil1939-C5)-methyltransferase
MPLINIDKLAFGGSGFGRIDGKACFVPYTAPGDVAEISISKDKRSYSEGVLNKLLKSSDSRIQPICPVFGICGGCNWQHISYDEQCLQKDQIFADTLWRSARVDASRIKPVLRSSSPFNYRQRVQLKVSFAGGKLSLGFYRTASHHVVDLPGRCDIAIPALNNALDEVRSLLTSFGEPHEVKQVDLVSSADGHVSLLFHYIGDDTDELSRYLAASEKSLCTIHGVAIKAGRNSSIRHIFGSERVAYAVPDSGGGEMELYFSPDSFSQVNFAQNRVIIESIIDFCSSTAPSTILDLFCGNGNFSLPLAKISKKIVGYESFEKSVSLAGYNALSNGINHANYICRDSAEGVDAVAEAGEFFDLVIIDPPRAGADSIAGKLCKVAASHIIYISCDPPTLSRDLATLQKSGFEVMSIQPVDMFPQTYHLESITFLKKSNQ